ncbi:MAG: hypothetical protein QM775_00560 [Pirellulales bacterium]
MRNPSPYNLFTDLSPGLFTHVGIVATETGADGIRRFVIVDVPERGDRVPAVNVETYLERTLHYFFLRDDDAKAAAAMARAAGEVIDNPSQFDLNFRSDRVERLAKKSLADEKVHTYCAGLLLLCALQSDVPRAEYFPLSEKQAGGRTVENVAKMGLSLGEGFLSPSGALFSPRLKIVGRREPMYDPRREVEEAVFDQFAKLLVVREMQARGDWFDALRLKTAEAAKSNPLLAQALASAAGVASETDLVAAAKAAAVVETLDEVAFAASADFQAARDALRNAPLPADATPQQRTRQAAAARRHAALIQALQQGRIAPRSPANIGKLLHPIRQRRVGTPLLRRTLRHRYQTRLGEGDAMDRGITELRVLYELRGEWAAVSGCMVGAFQGDTRIDEYSQAEGSWEELDFADVMFRFERHFGFTCGEDEWNELFRFDLATSDHTVWKAEVAPRLTFGALARFIAARATVVPQIEPITFQPVTLLGRTCAPAGAFVGIEQAAKLAGDEVRFAPSMRIIDAFRGERLDEFWRELRWWTNNALPELPKHWRGAPSEALSLGCLACFVAAFASCVMGSFLPIVAALIVSFLIYKAAAIYKRVADPLPSSFVTFRDLALWITASDFPRKATS